MPENTLEGVYSTMTTILLFFLPGPWVSEENAAFAEHYSLDLGLKNRPEHMHWTAGYLLPSLHRILRQTRSEWSASGCPKHVLNSLSSVFPGSITEFIVFQQTCEKACAET